MDYRFIGLAVPYLVGCCLARFSDVNLLNFNCPLIRNLSAISYSVQTDIEVCRIVEPKLASVPGHLTVGNDREGPKKDAKVRVKLSLKFFFSLFGYCASHVSLMDFNS